MTQELQKPEKKKEGMFDHYGQARVFNEAIDLYEKYHNQEIAKLQAQLADDKDGCIENCVEVAELRKDNDDLREQLHNKVFQEKLKYSDKDKEILMLQEETARLYAELYDLQAKLKRSSVSVEEIEDIMTKEYSRDKHFVNNKDYSNATLNVISSEKKWIAQAIIDAINAKEE